MTLLTCCAGGFRTLSRAAAKAAKSKLRDMGLGATAPDWPARAAECERCPMRVIRAGVTYCGQPLLEHVARDPSAQGCGCPTRAKAKSPDEHCPLDHANRAAGVEGGKCNCKWCGLARMTNDQVSMTNK